MKISKLVVVCGALAMGATLAADSNSNQMVVAPSQGGVGGGSIRIETAVLKGQPYSAEIENESVQTLSDGNKIVRKTTGRVFRDVEGRTRREDDQPNGNPTVTISDPVAGLSWTLNTAAKTAREMTVTLFRPAGALREMVTARAGVVRPSGEPTTAGVPAGGIARSGGGGRVVGGAGGGVSGGGAAGGVAVAPTPIARGGGAGGGGRVVARAGTDVVEEALPNKSIENLLCTGVRRTTTIAKGVIGNEQPIKIVSEEWKSIDLQVLVLTDLSDPRTGRSTYKLSNVRRADPDLMLFKVPSDYTIARGGGRGGDGN